MSADEIDADAPMAEPLRPALRVVRGEPTAEELAALTALLATAGGGDAPVGTPGRRGGWNDPLRQHRPCVIPGPNAWRAAAW